MSELKRYVVRESIANQGFSIRDNTELHPHTIMPTDDVCALLNDLTEKVARLDADLVEAKERFETRTIDFNNAYNANATYAQQVRELKAECERLRVDAKALVDVVRGNQLAKEQS